MLKLLVSGGSGYHNHYLIVSITDFLMLTISQCNFFRMQTVHLRSSGTLSIRHFIATGIFGAFHQNLYTWCIGLVLYSIVIQKDAL